MLGSNSSISCIVLYNYNSNTSCNHKNTNYEEKPEEPLSIVTEIAAITFLVAFTDFLPLISKHGIDFTDMPLHLCGHPLAFFGKQFWKSRVATPANR